MRNEYSGWFLAEYTANLPNPSAPKQMADGLMAGVVIGVGIFIAIIAVIMIISFFTNLGGWIRKKLSRP